MRKIVVRQSLNNELEPELGYDYQPKSPALGYEAEELDSHHSTDHYEDHTDYHKHFYAFEAPYDSVDESELIEHKISAQSKKNLQVVFIKAPENRVVDSALHALATQTNEDKTAIYVLNKQTDPHELASKLSVLQTQHKHKPQVHFVKYRTEEEALQAQQHIQAQYGGATSQSLESLQQPSLGYSQTTEPAPQAYYTDKQPLASHGYYPQELSAVPPEPHPTYLPPLSNYGSLPQSYEGGADQGRLDLPPLPLPEQQLAPSPYDLDARTARSRRIDFRVNERHRSDSRMVFPTEKSYLPSGSKSYLTPQKSRRRAHF
ncbi:uncharacterized protein Dvir_GJ14176 [Drosophila virilis]|uniref:DUF243 domain-containing protein n=1 Tax=Drosophila virilis TaxID=7244 RepID=B4MC34_DROVI|nr:uncharacterized protein LOC6635044 [Drosophila virilis]EDW58655.2 uncharacterized protein Dvir_GJ14176 [Drosophila virilis]